jgi:PadR family transcriptional regulator, regulatory protein AphA
MSTVRLTTASYVVLGLIEYCQPATVYDLKQLSAKSVVNFWALPHTQLYTESERLAKAGLLDEQREPTGRRRRVYRITDEGLAALEEWRAEPATELYEVHDPGTLKLFFGGDPQKLATTQLAAHQEKLQEYERTREELNKKRQEWPHGMKLALEAGIGLQRQFIRFWSEIAEGTDIPQS